MDNPLVIISAITLVLNLAGTLAVVSWKMSRVEPTMKLALKEALDETTKEIDERIDRHVRYFGEGVAAVRQKINDVELYCRDNFVKKDEHTSQFIQLRERIEILIGKMGQ